MKSYAENNYEVSNLASTSLLKINPTLKVYLIVLIFQFQKNLNRVIQKRALLHQYTISKADTAIKNKN